MLEAALWSLAASSTLLIGAALALVVDIPKMVRGLILAFGAGVLFGSVAYELVLGAVDASMTGLDVGFGFALGAVTFFLGSWAVDRFLAREIGGGSNPRRRARRAAGLALFLGTVLDGLPEAAVLGLSTASGEGVSVSIFVAILLANAPEAVAASDDLSAGGLGRLRIMVLWVVVAIGAAVAAAGGAAIGEAAPVPVVIGCQAFAAGAILAMLSESAIPEAHEDGGRGVGLTLAFGFAVAAWLALKGGG